MPQEMYRFVHLALKTCYCYCDEVPGGPEFHSLRLVSYLLQEYGLQHSQSKMLMSIQSQMEDELNTIQETESTPVAEHNKLASLMHLEVRRQKHIRDACALLSRLQVSNAVANYTRAYLYTL